MVTNIHEAYDLLLKINHNQAEEISRLRAIVEDTYSKKRKRYPPGSHCIVCGAESNRLRLHKCPKCYYKWYKHARRLPKVIPVIR